MKRVLWIAAVLACGLSVTACGKESVATPALAEPAAKVQSANDVQNTVSSSATPSIEIGTDIASLTSASSSNAAGDAGDASWPPPDKAANSLVSNRVKVKRALAVSSADNLVEIKWDMLMPDDYSPEAVVEKYQDQIATLQDYTPEAAVLFQKIMEEMNNAPPNTELDKKWVRIPGFIAPLSQEDEDITEFLLVPYFGACIHSPPPPTNQIVFVQTSEMGRIPLDDSFYPVWVEGMIELDKSETDLGNASYRITNADTRKYEEVFE